MFRLVELFFFQAEDGIRDLVRSRGLGDVYKRQAFNGNVVKAAKRLIEERYSHLNNQHIKLMFIGKKAHDVMKRTNYPQILEFKELFHKVSFENVTRATDYIKEGFVKREFDEVMVIYNRFKNAATQFLETEQFLPIKKIENKTEKKTKADYIFDPEKEAMIEELVPKILNTTFYLSLIHISEPTRPY